MSFRERFYFRNPHKVIPQLFASVAAATGFLNTGMMRGWSSPGVPSLVESGQMELSTNDISWISSLPLVGAFVGSFLAGYPMDKIGRRKTLVLVSPLFSVAWFLVGFASNKWMVLIGRTLMGLMSGMGNPASQIYIAECASPRVRGALGSFTAVLLGVGILLGYLFGGFLSWNDEAILIGFFPIFQGFCMYFAPSSPVWLLTKNRPEEAKEALQRFRGGETNIEAEFERILESASKNKDAGKITISDFFERSVFKPAVLSLMIMLLQQLSGFSAIIYYNATIFESTGSSLDRNVSSVIIGFLLVVCTVLSITLVDRAGRRLLLLTSSLAMSLSLASMGVYFYVKENTATDESWNITHTLSWLPLACLMVYIIAFASGFNSVPFLILGEILPLRFRNVLGGISSGCNLLTGFAVVKMYPLLVKSIGSHGVFWIYAASCIFGSIFIYFFLPETKGKTIQEIEDFFCKLPMVEVEENQDMLRNTKNKQENV
ncbi:facilitated trehalose transporter Tret1-like [Artemia franciscana]|uniref:Major facilitator superfamily (MFS) profile domain-containing protein n=1 Tax=Artemia franciscana TaxID=6661 RepID=A0AA88LEM9_ARTSF|nr:hypothetical protein QYM36_002122 [Artemia franciscana]